MPDALPMPAVDQILAEVGRGAQTELRRASIEQAAKTFGGALLVGALARAAYGAVGQGRPATAPAKAKGVLKNTPFNPAAYSFPMPIKRPIEEKTASMPAANPFQGPSTPSGQWWHKPLILGASVGGIYGGYRLADRIAAARRHELMQARLEKARKEFEDATAGLFAPPADPSLGKAAAAPNPVVEKIASLYDLYKSANWADVKGQMLGSYLSIALPMAMTVGYINYQDAQKRQRANLLKQVLDQRAKDRIRKQPPEFYATPMPTPKAPPMAKAASDKPISETTATLGGASLGSYHLGGLGQSVGAKLDAKATRAEGLVDRIRKSLRANIRIHPDSNEGFRELRQPGSTVESMLRHSENRWNRTKFDPPKRYLAGWGDKGFNLGNAAIKLRNVSAGLRAGLGPLGMIGGGLLANSAFNEMTRPPAPQAV